MSHVQSIQHAKIIKKNISLHIATVYRVVIASYCVKI